MKIVKSKCQGVVWGHALIFNQSEQPYCCLIGQYFHKSELKVCKIQYVYSNPIFWHRDWVNFKNNPGGISLLCKIIGYYSVGKKSCNQITNYKINLKVCAGSTKSRTFCLIQNPEWNYSVNYSHENG